MRIAIEDPKLEKTPLCAQILTSWWFYHKISHCNIISFDLKGGKLSKQRVKNAPFAAYMKPDYANVMDPKSEGTTDSLGRIIQHSLG